MLRKIFQLISFANPEKMFSASLVSPNVARIGGPKPVARLKRRVPAGNTRLPVVLLAASALLLAGVGASSVAQDEYSGTPPVDPAAGPGGVDMVTGTFSTNSPSISVGGPEGGLSYFETLSGESLRSNLASGINLESGTGDLRVTILGSSEVFLHASGYVPERANGATLSYALPLPGVFTHVDRTGAVATFTGLVGTDAAVHGFRVAYLSSIEFPNGRILRYHYQLTELDGITYRRLQSVTNNHGYQIHFEYAQLPAPTTQAQLVAWLRLEHVRAINNAVEGCAPTASVCSLTHSWPQLDIDRPSATERTYTDSLGRVTRWQLDTLGRVTGVRRPGDGSYTQTVSYDGAGRTDSMFYGPLSFHYSYSDVSGTRTTTTTHTGGTQTRVESNLSTGRVTARFDARGERTSYQHDTHGRVTRVTAPEGDYVSYSYDNRGNVLETRRVAKPGSGLADLVTIAHFPTGCPNPKTCNQPEWVTDPSGATTNFSYISTHGGANLIQEPAPSAGADRPTTGVGFDAFHAWYYDGSGALIQDPDPIYLVDLIRRCRTGDLLSTCDGNFAEQRRRQSYYGSSGAPNNLQTTQTQVLNGGGAISRRTYFTYDNLGDLIAVDGPLPGSDDTVYMRYDALRRGIGQIGIDPDGPGPRLRPAARVTYDLNGRVVTRESGTVTGSSDPAWAAFVRLQRSTVSYDVANRPTSARAFASGSMIEALIQYEYGTDGRLICQARRMNPAVFSSPPSSACALGTEGADGPDRITRVDYDDDGRTTLLTTGWGTGAEIEQARYAYTDNGRLLSLTDGNGNRTLYSYDGFDRMAEIDYAHPTTPGANTGTDDEVFIYDSDGRLASRRVRTNQLFQYTYDDLGRVTNVNAPGMTADTSYTYDLHNNLVSITSAGRTITNAFNALSDHVSQSGPNGTVSYQYDSAGRRERMTWPDGNYITYDWNVASQLTHIRENGAMSGLGVLAEFTYDDQGRRTALLRGNGTQTSYTFDAAGRLASAVEDMTGTAADLTVSFDHNFAGQIIERSTSNASYTYAHSITVDTLFDHNGLNQITESDDGTNVLNPTYDGRGNLTAYNGRTFGYDYHNRLVSAGGTGGAMSLEYDPVGRLWQTVSVTGTFQFQYDGSAIIGVYSTSGALLRRWVHGPGMDEPLVRYDGSGMNNKVWLHADERGSIIAHTDTSGARVQTNTYDAYGTPGASNVGLFQYTGQVWLADAGVHYYKSRTYHPQLGVFMQADPIGHSGGVNLYAYVNGDPTNLTDPLGLSPQCGGDGPVCDETPDQIDVFGRRTSPFTPTDWSNTLDFIEQLQNFFSIILGFGSSGGTGSDNGEENTIDCPSMYFGGAAIQEANAVSSLNNPINAASVISEITRSMGRIQELEEETFEATKSRFSGGAHNNAADAWRHFRINFTLTRELGHAHAYVIMSGYEVLNRNPISEHVMDARNNWTGRAFASHSRLGSLSPNQAADLALASGCLQEAP